MLQYMVKEVSAGLCTGTLRSDPVEKCVKSMAQQGWNFEKMNTITGRFLLFWQRYKMLIVFSKDVDGAEIDSTVYDDDVTENANTSNVALIGCIIALIGTLNPVYNFLRNFMWVSFYQIREAAIYGVGPLVGAILNLVGIICAIVGLVGLIICLTSHFQNKDYSSKINLPLGAIIGYIVLDIVVSIMWHRPIVAFYNIFAVLYFFSRIFMLAGVIVAKVALSKKGEE